MNLRSDLLMREAGLTDLPEIARIMEDAVERMLAEGKCQWDENYPTAIHIFEDISRGTGYVMESGGRVAAYGAVVFAGEPAYLSIAGEWLSDGPYVVVHRMAVAADFQGRGIAEKFLAAVEYLAVDKGAKSFRIDTNFDNNRMLRVLEKSGFEYCGEVSYEKGSRMAFEKLI